MYDFGEISIICEKSSINSLDKLARPVSKGKLWWLKQKHPSLNAEYYSHYVNY
jgi:hypothetical protein